MLNIFIKKYTTFIKATHRTLGMVFILLLTFSSCDFLELESPDGVLEETVISSADGIRAARIGMYAALAEKDYYGGFFPLAVEAHSDNGANGGYDVESYNQLGTLKAVTSSNIIIEKMWLSMYNPINVANKILDNVDKISMDKAEAENIKGEALFVRALCHFDALRTWGEHWDAASTYGIPVVTTPLSFDRVTPRSTVANTYTAIIKDLTEASNLVSNEGKGKTFVTTSAVKALLARAYLYQGDAASAATTATSVLDSIGNVLFDKADYGKIFTTKESAESIFELGFTTQSRSSYNQLSYVRPEAIRSEIVFLMNADMDKFFKTRTDDVRAATINFKNNDATIAPDGRSEKYRGEQTRDNPAYILRVAEMYLIAAEAGGKVNGLAYLNTLRTARGMKALAASTTDADFVQAVADERRAELNNEGHRYFDLARTNKVQDVMGKDVKSNFPIPLREITASNGTILQNKGY
jgi:hypothetical protein